MSPVVQGTLQRDGLSNAAFSPLSLELSEYFPQSLDAKEFWSNLRNIPLDFKRNIYDRLFHRDALDLPQNKLDVLAALSCTGSGRWAILKLLEHADIQSLFKFCREPFDWSLSSHIGPVAINELSYLNQATVSEMLTRDDRQVSLHLAQALANVDLAAVLKTHLKTVTYNVWGVPPISGYGCREPWRFRSIGEELAARGYDFIGLQELWDPNTQVILSTLKEAGYNIVAHCAGHLRGSSGLAIACRHPIESSGLYSFQTTAGIERLVGVRKGVLWIYANLPDGSKVFFSTSHLLSPPASLNRSILNDEEAANIRLRQVSEWIKKKKTLPVADIEICSGDMNCSESSYEYEALHTNLGHDSYRLRYPSNYHKSNNIQIERACGNTFVPNTDRKTMQPNPWAEGPPYEATRLDYIFLKSAALHSIWLQTKLAFNSHSALLSDHYAVEANLFQEKAIK